MEKEKWRRGVFPKTDYPQWCSVLSNHLGGIYPFYSESMTGVVSLDIRKVITEIRAAGKNIELDAVGLAAKSINTYLLGNRTLIKSVYRAPWFCSYNSKMGWMAERLPAHGAKSPKEPEEFTRELKSALINEVKTYVQGADSVGILLSGGMDSRVVAGVVREVQRLENNRFKVVGLTWGAETSRDVVYARRITERFGWEWQHYSLTAETLERNIRYMGNMGAEVSPLHLHAMPDIAATTGIDVVLAGSYGDSVGRAEFSGKHLTKLNSLLGKQKDKFGILRREIMRKVQAGLNADLLDNPHLKGNISDIRRREIEQECHYMRRMLQCCMNTIAEHKRFYQVFTSPEVFGLMWQLAPELRDNRWYIYLLKQLPGKLLEIPWARTGRLYDNSGGEVDRLSKSYHEYGHWLRNDLREQITERVNSDKIRSLGLFNDCALDYSLKAWQRSRTRSVNSLDELFSWIASLHDFIEIHGVQPSTPFARNTWIDRINAVRGGIYARTLVEVRNLLRA